MGQGNASFIANSSWFRGGLRPKPIPELEELPLSNSAGELREARQDFTSNSRVVDLKTRMGVSSPLWGASDLQKWLEHDYSGSHSEPQTQTQTQTQTEASNLALVRLMAL